MQLPTNSGDIKRLSNALGLEREPVLLQVEPVEHALPSECFPNVDTQIEKAGGDKVYGWQLWQSGNLFIEAEFHTVWKDPLGFLHDITPKPNPFVTGILFLVDTNRVYEGRQVNNIRLNLSENRAVDDFIQLNDLKFFIENYGDRATQQELRLVGEEAAFYDHLWRLMIDLEHFMKEGGTVRAPCFCGSGEKYKKCHGKKIRALNIPSVMNLLVL